MCPKPIFELEMLKLHENHVKKLNFFLKNQFFELFWSKIQNQGLKTNENTFPRHLSLHDFHAILALLTQIMLCRLSSFNQKVIFQKVIL